MPALFKKSGTGSGTGKLEGVPDGFYIGELVAFEEGNPYVDPKTGEESPKVRWIWELYKTDGSPFMNPTTGEHQLVSEQTSTLTGPKATAAAWFKHHLKREWSSREDIEATQQECIGKRVNLVISTKSGEGGWRKIDVFPSA